jgi:hypothetical protein
MQTTMETDIKSISRSISQISYWPLQVIPCISLYLQSFYSPHFHVLPTPVYLPSRLYPGHCMISLSARLRVSLLQTYPCFQLSEPLPSFPRLTSVPSLVCWWRLLIDLTVCGEQPNPGAIIFTLSDKFAMVFVDCVEVKCCMRYRL